MKRARKQISIYLPIKARIGNKLHAQIAASAKANGRSRNSEVVARLVESFTREELKVVVAEAIANAMLHERSRKK